jgi:threonine synthase
VPAALLAEHDLTTVEGRALWAEWVARPSGLWSHHELLPVDPVDAVSLSEGGTPLLELPETVAGVPNPVYAKDERRNPTGSFKDRFFSVAVSWALSTGATTVALASSGNAGVSAAAYAAAAGLRAVVVATDEISSTCRAALELHGATLVPARDSVQRWDILRCHAVEDGWTVLTNTSTPPVSSLWVGIEAYKTVAYELVRDLGGPPDVVVVPVSRGDGFAGMWNGFRELRELGVIDHLPRMVAVERYPSLTRALATGAELPDAVEPDGLAEASSIGDPQATVMSLQVVRQSGGTAVVCDDAELREAARRLGRAGLAVELSSAAVLVAVDRLREHDRFHPDDRVVALVTSHAANQPETLPTPT